MGDRDKHWFVLRVGVGAGDEIPKAAQHLYFPMRTIRVYNRRHRVWSRRQELAFPGYAFALASHPSEISLNPVPGISLYGFLRNADRSYAVVRHREMERCNADLETPCSNVVVPLHKFAVGSDVKVVEGPFRNFAGTVVSPIHPHGDVDLSLKGPVGSLKVRIPATDIVALVSAA